jgi:hypothetical protein
VVEYASPAAANGHVCRCHYRRDHVLGSWEAVDGDTAAHAHPEISEHDPLTLLDAATTNLLNLSATQQLSLDAQLPHTVLSGPATGLAAPPTCRLLAAADLPSHDLVSTHSYAGGAALDVFGLSAPNTIARLTPSANPGAAAALLRTEANGGLLLNTNTLAVDAVNRRVGIGTASPALMLEVVGDGITGDVGGRTYINTAVGASALALYKARGAVALPASVVAADTIGSVLFQGYNAGTFRIGARIRAILDDNPGATNIPTALQFWTATAAAAGAERMRISSAGNVGIGTAAPATLLHTLCTDAATAAVVNVITLGHNSTGTPAAGFGSGLLFQLQSSTTVNQYAGRAEALWVSATHATRTARLALSATDWNGWREGLRLEADGAAARLGFYGVAAVIRPTALTAPLTTLTATAPGTPDYAVQDFVDVALGAGWAFANHDEANTVLSVISNLQVRMAELETKLQALGLLT